MNKFLPIQLRFKTYILLSLITLTLLPLFLGAYTQAKAQSTTEEVEVLSIPPQEAYYIEDKTQESFSSDEPSSYPEEELDDSNTPTYTPNDLENIDNPPANIDEFQTYTPNSLTNK
ncbi:hypothetical protein [Scytonema sp. NUACC26]|uniref:hypothetical protein n=1 Tax=Scytonema sp. NUACC26 TaxID=3140176 RepID=UPI0034DC7920